MQELEKFLKENCYAMPQPPPPNYLTYTVDANFLYSEYVQWARIHGSRPVGKTDFLQALQRAIPGATLQNVGRGSEFINMGYNCWPREKKAKRA